MALTEDEKTQRIIAEDRHNVLVALLTKQNDLLEKILKALPSNKEEEKEKE